MKEYANKAKKIIIVTLLIVMIAFIIYTATKALSNTEINFAEYNGKIFTSDKPSYMRIYTEYISIDGVKYNIKAVENDVVIVNVDEEDTFSLKFIDENTIYCTLERRFYYAKN